MSSTTLITSRDPKGQSFVNTVAAAYDKAGLDGERAQQLNESKEFVPELRKLIRLCSLVNQFANEEVVSTHDYYSGYKKPKPITAQVEILKEFFPELRTFDESVATRDLPTDDVEGYFAIPRWERIASTYGEAVQRVLDIIKQVRKGELYNCRKDKLGPQWLRQRACTVDAFKQLGDQQEGHDILVVPCQFGILHRGQSVRRAHAVMPVGEFGLDTFSAGIMLLTQPERLQHLNDLGIDCAGDEYDPVIGGAFRWSPCFYFFYDVRLELGTNAVDHKSPYYGSASGFLTQ